jgi:hypothetical protein
MWLFVLLLSISASPYVAFLSHISLRSRPLFSFSPSPCPSPLYPRLASISSPYTKSLSNPKPPPHRSPSPAPSHFTPRPLPYLPKAQVSQSHQILMRKPLTSRDCPRQPPARQFETRTEAVHTLSPCDPLHLAPIQRLFSGRSPVEKIARQSYPSAPVCRYDEPWSHLLAGPQARPQREVL